MVAAALPSVALVAGAVDVPDDDADGERAELDELAALEAAVRPKVLEAYGLRSTYAKEPVPVLHTPIYGKDVLPPALTSPGRAGVDAAPGPVPPARPDAVRAVLGMDPEHLAPLDVPFEWREPILRFVDFFRGKGRKLVERWAARSGRYFPMMQETFAKAGLPLDLLYVSFVESGLNPKALSGASASGLWQFMRVTGGAYGLVSDYWLDERRIPERATEAAAKHLKALHDHFGSWDLALAAYNGGGATVSNAVKKLGTNDFWELARYDTLPEQTRMYVPKVLAVAFVAKNLEALGLGPVTREPPLRYEYGHVPGSVDVAVVAKAAGVPVDAVRELNPELKRCCTPPDRTDYRVRLPEGTGKKYAEAIGALWPKSKVEFVRHVVKMGETLKNIAKRYGTSPAKIAAMNTVHRDGDLHPGLVLVVPRKADLPPPALLASADDAGTKSDAVVVMVPPEEYRYSDRVAVFYRVRGSDDLLGIAETFGVTPEEVVMWNALDAESEVMTGMVLRLYVKKDAGERAVLLDPSHLRVVVRGSDDYLAMTGRKGGLPMPVGLTVPVSTPTGPGSPAALAKGGGVHVVRKGDSLWKIAKLYGVDVGTLKAVNGLSGRDPMLMVGRKLIVPGLAPAKPEPAKAVPAAPKPAPGAPRAPKAATAASAPKTPAAAAAPKPATAASAPKTPAAAAAPKPGTGAAPKPAPAAPAPAAAAH
jgi:membrane-bound lytic murein transglycosylase D